MDASEGIQLLQDVERLAKGRLTEFAAQRGFSLTESLVLDALREDPGLSISDLSRRIDHSKGHVSTIAERLARAGLVLKTQDAVDHRLTRLFLTDEGGTFQASLKGQHETFVEDLLGGVGRQHLLAVNRGLERLQNVLTSVESPRPLQQRAVPSPLADGAVHPGPPLQAVDENVAMDASATDATFSSTEPPGFVEEPGELAADSTLPLSEPKQSSRASKGEPGRPIMPRRLRRGQMLRSGLVALGLIMLGNRLRKKKAKD